MRSTARSIDLSRIIRETLKHGPDMRIPEALRHYGPPCGMTSARLVGYFEIGKHPEINMQSQEVVRDKVDLVFELSGPNCAPVVTKGGARLPYLVTIKETMSLNEKSNFYKLFTTMNAAHGGKARHMVQMLGKAFRMELFLQKVINGTATLAVPKGPNGYNIRGVTYQDEETGEAKTVVVDPAITELKAFVWDLASKALWDSIYIPGQYEERKNDKGEVTSPAKSKNVFQNRIRAAANFAEIKDLVALKE